MNFLRAAGCWGSRSIAVILLGIACSIAQNPAPSSKAGAEVKRKAPNAFKTYPPELVQKGAAQFRQDCSFCHGRDAGGGESGPDLTRSKLVAADLHGDKIGPVIRNGRVEKGMPPFDRPDDQIASLVAFIHTQQINSRKSASGRSAAGGRKGVDPSDLQTGSVDAGRLFFEGAGGCVKCHSPQGDLAGIASRLKGLELEEQMLYPKHAKSKVTVTSAGQTATGTLAYLDEFTVALVDASGSYRSWRIRDVQYQVDEPVKAHVDLFDKYTDANDHNLMAYLQTLR